MKPAGFHILRNVTLGKRRPQRAHDTAKAVLLSDVEFIPRAWLTTEMTDEEERATGVRLEHSAARAPPHSVHRIVSPLVHTKLHTCGAEQAEASAPPLTPRKSCDHRDRT